VAILRERERFAPPLDRPKKAGETVSIPALAGIFFGESNPEVLARFTQMRLGPLRGICRNLASELWHDSHGRNSRDMEQAIDVSDSGDIIPGPITTSPVSKDLALGAKGRLAVLHAYRERGYGSTINKWFGSVHPLAEPLRAGDMQDLLTGETKMVGVINPRSWEFYFSFSNEKLTPDQARRAVNELRGELIACKTKEGEDTKAPTLYRLYEEYIRRFQLEYGIFRFDAKRGGLIRNGRKAQEVDVLPDPLTEGQYKALFSAVLGK